jgi:HipA-like protein
MDFPVKEKKYTNEELWPFFATRIPSLNQPYQIKKIENAKISKNDSVGLLKLFGAETITNPFRLVAY